MAILLIKRGLKISVIQNIIIIGIVETGWRGSGHARLMVRCDSSLSRSQALTGLIPESLAARHLIEAIVKPRPGRGPSMDNTYTLA